ncbi:MAG: hypothetical protein ACYTET_04800 [Planctomycetota bacterium]|jgi:hypothetical protein
MDSKTTNTTEKTDKAPFKWTNLLPWWPFLLGPASMIIVVIAYKTGWKEFYAKGTHESLALVLVPLAAIFFITAAVQRKRPLIMILAALATAFFFREWHFTGTGKGIYYALVALGIWAGVWHKKIAIDLQYVTLKIWMFATFWTYFLSQFTARRAFRDLRLPLEDPLHVPWEEVLETTAHIMLITLAFIAYGYQAWKTQKSQEKTQVSA